MTLSRLFSRIACGLGFCLFALPVRAADYPAPKQGDWIVRDFRFHTGEVLPELRLHYTTVGAPSGEPVLVLHGSAGAGANMLNPSFAGELFGPGSRSSQSLLHYLAGRARRGKIVQAIRWPARGFPEIQLRRHRAGAISIGDRKPGRAPPASGAGKFRRRDASVAMGRDLPGFYGRARGACVAAGRSCRTQLDHAPYDHRYDPQRPGVEWRQLHQATAQSAGGSDVFQYGDQRRQRRRFTRRRRRRKRPINLSSSA